jgi:hypothetical protein
MPALGVPGIVQQQRALLVRGGHRVRPQQFDPPDVQHLVVPRRFGQEPLQALYLPVLSADPRLGVGQRGQGLVPVPWAQQGHHVVPQRLTLGP